MASSLLCSLFRTTPYLYVTGAIGSSLLEQARTSLLDESVKGFLSLQDDHPLT